MLYLQWVHTIQTMNIKHFTRFWRKDTKIDNLMMQPKIVTFSIWVSFGSVNVLLCFGQQGWHVDWDNI